MKVAIITGASSGIGLATAKLFVQKGYKVYGVAKDKYNGDDFECFVADVNDAERMKQIIDQVVETDGHIDCFINNAGFGTGGEHVDTNIQTIQKLYSTNLVAAAVNMAMVGQIMKKQGYGKILNTSSLACLFPLPYQAIYSSSKAGIDVLTRTLRGELKQYNVWVSEVLPGDVATGFTDAREKAVSSDKKVNKSVGKFEKYERGGMSPNKVAKQFYKLAEKKHPRPRVCVGALKYLIPLQKILPIRWLDWLIKKIYC